MITCDQAKQLFNPFLDGALSESLRCELHAHQLACSKCRRDLAILQTTAEVIARDESEPALGDQFTDRLLACINESNRKRNAPARYRIWAFRGLSAAAAVALAFTGWFTFLRETPQKTLVASQVIEVYPVSVAGRMSPLPTNDAILVPTVGYLADSAASAVSRGRNAIGAFTEIGQWGVIHAQTSLLMGAAEAEDSGAALEASEPIDYQQVAPLFDLSDIVNEPAAPSEPIELI